MLPNRPAGHRQFVRVSYVARDMIAARNMLIPSRSNEIVGASFDFLPHACHRSGQVSDLRSKRPEAATRAFRCSPLNRSTAGFAKGCALPPPLCAYVDCGVWMGLTRRGRPLAGLACAEIYKRPQWKTGRVELQGRREVRPWVIWISVGKERVPTGWDRLSSLVYQLCDLPCGYS